jgi:hypothetical protein
MSSISATLPDIYWRKTYKKDDMAPAFHKSFITALKNARNPHTSPNLLALVDSFERSCENERLQLLGNLVISDYVKSQDYIATEDRLDPFDTICDRLAKEVDNAAFTEECETMKVALRHRCDTLSSNAIDVRSDEVAEDTTNLQKFNQKSVIVGNMLFLLQFGAPGWHQEAGYRTYGRDST